MKIKKNIQLMIIFFMLVFNQMSYGQDEGNDKNSIEEKSRNYLLELNSTRNLNLTPFQLNRWISILVEYDRVMSIAENDTQKEYYKKKYQEAVADTLREFQIKKM